MVVVLPTDHDLAEDVKTEIDVNALGGMTLLTPSPEDSPGYFERLNQLCAVAHFTPRPFALCMAWETCSGWSLPAME